MAATAIYLLNLPHGISVEDLRTQLLCQTPELFPSGQNITVQVFPQAISYVAVVAGFSTNFDKLRLKFRHVVLKNTSTGVISTSITIKLDTGEIRTDLGEFLENKPPGFRRRLEQLAGLTHRKCFHIFNPKFLNEVNQLVHTGFNPTLFIKDIVPEELIMMELAQPGHLLFRKRSSQGSMIRYDSELESLQAICYLNGNENAVRTANKNLIIGNKNVNSSINRKRGFETNGTCLDLEGLMNTKGYIPIGEMSKPGQIDPYYINFDFKRSAETSLTCWNCKGEFKVVGVDMFNNFLAAKCACIYNSALPIMNQNRAVSWPNEGFTRLILENRPKVNEKFVPQLCINFYPMKQQFQHPNEYMTVVAPMLFNDWKKVSTDFKLKNCVEGTCTWFQEIEVVVNSRPPTLRVAAQIRLNSRTPAWSTENPHAISKLNIAYDVTDREFVYEETRKGKLHKIVDHQGNIWIHVNVELPRAHLKYLREKIRVIPKANKSEYQGVMNLIKTFAKAQTEQEPRLQMFLNPSTAKPDVWGFDDNLLEKGKLEQMLKDLLNEEQHNAISTAVNNSCSFIHGPPGTGKTFTLSILVNFLLQKENGIILVCAPSNFAANGLAKAIMKHSFPKMQQPTVVRILSKSHESYQHSDVQSEDGFDELHRTIQRQEEWLNTDDILPFAHLIREGEEKMLTAQQHEIFEKHIALLQTKCVQKYNVYVATVGALLDKRIIRWSKVKPISTCIIDEAGQLNHPLTLAAILIDHKRVVFAGDHQQLSPLAGSFATETAGLNTSLMEIVSMNRMSTVPWTELMMQYRMHPEIGLLVSNLTYQGKLKPSASVTQRTDPMFKLAHKKYNGHRVNILDHSGFELKVGTSYKNETEGKIIKRTVTDLLNLKIPADKIVVLTFYEAQRKEIQTNFQKANLNVAVKNVDAFQGREASVVIISCVRSNRQKDIGFAINPNRLNVGISRAMEFLFVAANFNFFKEVKTSEWKRFMTLLKQ